MFHVESSNVVQCGHCDGEGACRRNNGGSCVTCSGTNTSLVHRCYPCSGTGWVAINVAPRKCDCDHCRALRYGTPA
jgi:hypothetical protein